MTNPLDQYLRDMLIERAVGGPEGVDRLIEAARTGDFATMAAHLDGTEHYPLVDLVSRLLQEVLVVAAQTALSANNLFAEALLDIRDHGGTLDDVIAGMPALAASMGAQQDSPEEQGGSEGGLA